MKKILFFGILGLCFLFCGCKPKKNNPDDNEEKIESIAVYDKSQSELIRESVYQQTSSTAIYKHENVFVYAIYEDKTKKDITAFASFSNVDLTQLGEQEVTVTYYNFTCSYIVEVVEDPVVRISLNVDSARRLFTIGETFSTSGLIVSGTHASGRKETIDKYTTKVTDSNNIFYDRVPFSISGMYDVRVSVGKVSASYQIAVKEKNAKITESFNLSTLDREYDIDGKYVSLSEEKIFDGSLASIYAKSTTYRYKDENGNLVRKDYEGKSYTRVLEVTDYQNEESNEFLITLNLTYDTDIVLLTSPTTERNLMFTSADGRGFDYAVGNTNELFSILYIRLKAGSYGLKTITEPIYIYNFDFYRIGNVAASNIERLELDLQYAKLNYKVGESFNYNLVQVIAYYRNGLSEFISGDLWDHEAWLSLDGMPKSSLDVPGIYTVTIYYKGHSVSYKITVTDK